MTEPVEPGGVPEEPMVEGDTVDVAEATPGEHVTEDVAEATPGDPASGPALVSEANPGGPAAAGSTGLRLAGLHLRTGLLGLARAELEAFAGRGLLDEAALLDLAEVRWRTGDLAGAGDAAAALLARGRDETLALVIATEAVSALGRPGEARRLARRAADLHPGPLEPLFAGMPMAPAWPVVTAVPTVSAAASSTAAPGAGRRSRSRRPVSTASEAATAAPAAAAAALAGGRGALAAGDQPRAALLLGIALRLEPGFADEVLGAMAGLAADGLLALVEGDALRLLGREAEALDAFDRARGDPAGAAQTKRSDSAASGPADGASV
jgi:tetratricopeptide (TPR) repeat protein